MEVQAVGTRDPGEQPTCRAGGGSFRDKRWSNTVLGISISPSLGIKKIQDSWVFWRTALLWTKKSNQYRIAFLLWQGKPVVGIDRGKANYQPQKVWRCLGFAWAWRAVRAVVYSLATEVKKCPHTLGRMRILTCETTWEKNNRRVAQVTAVTGQRSFGTCVTWKWKKRKERAQIYNCYKSFLFKRSCWTRRLTYWDVLRQGHKRSISEPGCNAMGCAGIKMCSWWW